VLDLRVDAGEPAGDICHTRVQLLQRCTRPFAPLIRTGPRCARRQLGLGCRAVCRGGCLTATASRLEDLAG
jgi:hypothetical protein